MIGMEVPLAAHLHGLLAVVVQITMVMQVQVQVKAVTARPHLLVVVLLGTKLLHLHRHQLDNLMEDTAGILLRLMINRHPDMASHMQWVLLLAWPRLLLVLGLYFKIMVMRAVLLHLQVMHLRLR
jgi:hypothetical protein